MFFFWLVISLYAGVVVSKQLEVPGVRTGLIPCKEGFTVILLNGDVS
jgi:hypothetical protein